MPDLCESEIRAMLGSVRYEFSHQVSLLDISVNTWRGASLTHVATATPLSFMMENRTLALMSLSDRLSGFRRASAIDIGNGLYSNIPDESFRGEADRAGDAVSVFITPSLLESLLDTKYSPEVTLINLRGVRSAAPLAYLMRALLEDVQAGSPSGPVLGESIIAAIAGITHPIAIGKHEIKDRRKADLPTRTLNTIRDMIGADVAKPHHLPDLAAVANMSVRHFSRAFRQSTGLTPHQYILRARVEVARNLVSSTSLSYDKIAWTAGFSDRNHMATVFRKLIGVAPSHFRRC